MSLTITESAAAYLVELIQKQDDNEDLGIRFYVNDPGTSRAESCIAFCRPADRNDDDLVTQHDGFKGYIELKSEAYLEEAVVDYAPDRMGGQLTIKAPNAKIPQVDDDSPIDERINYILYSEINPSLASHGGEVSLQDIVNEEGKQVAVLKFGGGCQGCGMVDTTLKDGVEKTLLERIPELSEVRDITDHSVRDNAYYK